jgi:hypothetical protein
VLGPWTHPATGASFTKCRRCDATLEVAGGEVVGTAAATRPCTTKRVARPKPEKVRRLDLPADGGGASLPRQVMRALRAVVRSNGSARHLLPAP